MGQGGFLNLVNASPYTWAQTFHHSYQMNKWDWPATVPSGKAATVYIEWDESIFDHTKDDGGEVTYTLIDAPSKGSFQIQARVNNGFDLQVWLENISTNGHANSSTINLGWAHDGYVNWILSGSEGHYSSSQPPTDWMQKNLGTLGNRPLRHIVIPGSHDSGMSYYNSQGGTLGAFDCNVLTQHYNISQQLSLGARYFDIRPVISSGKFLTGHYSAINETKKIIQDGITIQLYTWQGANGEPVADVVSEINAFTASHNELVIINLSHALNTDRANTEYTDFTAAEWDQLFLSLNSTLKHLYVAPAADTVDLGTLPLNAFIGKNQSAVVVLVGPDAANLTHFNWNKSGFYKGSQLATFNDYSNTVNADTMIQGQLGHLKDIRKNPDSEYFLLSWTLTQQTKEVIGCVPHVEPSILDLADGVNHRLYTDVLGVLTPATYPNILYTDGIKSSDVAAISMAFNDYVNGGK